MLATWRRDSARRLAPGIRRLTSPASRAVLSAPSKPIADIAVVLSFRTRQVDRRRRPDVPSRHEADAAGQLGSSAWSDPRCARHHARG
jgi:hypothetical protein